MRLAPVLVVLLAACHSDQELRYTSTLQAGTNGVVLSDDGTNGEAAMDGTTCTINVNWGCPVADIDLPTMGEQVVDTYDGQTLGTSDEGAHTIQPDGLWDPALDIPALGVRTGRLWQDGTLLVGGDLDQCWVQADGGAQVSVPAEVCSEEAEYTVDRITGTVFVAGGGALFAVGPDGGSELPVTGDLASWDPATQQLFTARAGSRHLAATDRDGNARWTVETEGGIAQVAVRGNQGEVLVLIARDGIGEVQRRSSSDGRLLGRSPTPTVDGELVVSANGARLGVVRPDEVDFFAIDDGHEKLVLDKNPLVRCIDPLVQATRD